MIDDVLIWNTIYCVIKIYVMCAQKKIPKLSEN